MAVWSVVNYSYAIPKLRIDSEFYQPNYLKLENLFARACPLGESIRDVATELPKQFKKTNSEDRFQYNDISSIDPLSGTVLKNIVRIKDAPGRAVFINNTDDVLISTVRPNRNANTIIEDLGILQVSSNGFCNLRATGVDPNYLFLYSKTKYFRDYLVRYSKSSMYPAVANIDILRFPFFRPKQSSVIEEISNQVKHLRKLRLDAESYYSQAVIQFESTLGLDNITFQKKTGYITRASDLACARRADAEYYNPGAREIVQRITALKHSMVRDSFNVAGGFPWNSKMFLPDNSGAPVVRIRNIKPVYITPDELTSIDLTYAYSVGAVKAKKGDIVVGMDGIRYFNASLLEDECFVNQRVCHLSPRANANVSSEYAAFVINSVVGQEQLMRDMTVATTVGHITNRDVAKLIIPTISTAFHDEVTALVRKSIDYKERSKRLLEQAKARIERILEKESSL